MPYGTFIIHRPDGYTITQDVPIPMQFIAELFPDKYPVQARPHLLSWFSRLEPGESVRLPGDDGFYAVITRTA